MRSYSSRLEFSISHFLLTRLKSAEEQELATHDSMIDAVARSGRTLATWRSLFSELQNFFAFTTAVVLLGVGIGATSLGLLTIGDVLAFYVMAMLFRGQYTLFSYALAPVLEGAQSLSTVHEVFVLEDDPPYQGTKRIDYKGGLRFQDVVFGYDEGTLLDGVTFELRPGETAGIVGPNGSGKTTIVKLMLGFYRANSGQIFADTESLSALDIQTFRRHIGVVMQDPMLFGGTVAENICYGERSPSEDDMVAAAKTATVDSFIAELVDGYYTYIGDEGVMLSGGQRQKISIARAIYHRPRLLILDEPTNHLDSNSIDAILSNLARLPQNPSVLIISHDVRVLKSIDAVYRLEGKLLQPM